jgi:hypothetical protein
MSDHQFESAPKGVGSTGTGAIAPCQPRRHPGCAPMWEPPERSTGLLRLKTVDSTDAPNLIGRYAGPAPMLKRCTEARAMEERATVEEEATEISENLEGTEEETEGLGDGHIHINPRR